MLQISAFRISEKTIVQKSVYILCESIWIFTNNSINMISSELRINFFNLYNQILHSSLLMLYQDGIDKIPANCWMISNKRQSNQFYIFSARSGLVWHILKIIFDDKCSMFFRVSFFFASIETKKCARADGIDRHLGNVRFGMLYVNCKLKVLW